MIVSPVPAPLGRFRRRISLARHDREAPPGLRDYLDGFVATHRGVEVWVEPATGFNKASILLVAGDGEWTRRTVPSTQWAQGYADAAGLRAYPAGIVGYPQRMRDWDIQHRS